VREWLRRGGPRDTQDEQHGGQDEQSGSGEAEGAIMVAMASLLMAEVQTKS
jgi:hypothetical protein